MVTEGYSDVVEVQENDELLTMTDRVTAATSCVLKLLKVSSCSDSSCGEKKNVPLFVSIVFFFKKVRLQTTVANFKCMSVYLLPGVLLLCREKAKSLVLRGPFFE